MLVVISGLPGVGKTTVSDLVADRLGAVRLSIDPVEDAMLASGCEPGMTTGIAAYEAVGAMAELNVRAGRIVVVDAVNDSEPARETWRRAAVAAGARICWIVLAVRDEAAHASRLRGRDRGFLRVGEPTWAEVVSRPMAPWEDTHLAIDTAAKGADAVAAEVERYVVESRRAV